MRARLLTIGDELLIGQVVDTNSAWIGQALAALGIQLLSKSTVGDEVADIAAALAIAATATDVVILTGGLGPTSDDRTVECLARHLDLPLELHDETWARIQYIFREVIRREMSGDQRKQAVLPKGALALRNEQGTAPGIWIEQDDIVYVAMPGVPREMSHLMEAEILPRLLDRFPVEAAHRITLQTVGMGETEIATAIADLEQTLPTSARLAYLPALGTVRVRVTVTQPSLAQAQAEAELLADTIENRLPKGAVFARGDVDLSAALHDALRGRGLRMATAESCTGGQVAALITARAGASEVFGGGVVAYDNAVKQALLGVDPQVLEQEGAVSEAVVTAMVFGAIERLGVDVAVSTSGVAGPGGGSEAKPVGTVWIAAGSRERVITRRLHLGRDRGNNIARASTAALDLLRRFVLDLA